MGGCGSTRKLVKTFRERSWTEKKEPRGFVSEKWRQGDGPVTRGNRIRETKKRLWRGF